jgi:glucoamylase
MPATRPRRWPRSSPALSAPRSSPRRKAIRRTADFILAYADWLAAHLEEWTVTTPWRVGREKAQPLHPHQSDRPQSPDPHADPNSTMIQIANGGGLHPARNVVGGDFLHLVRLGIPRPRPDRARLDQVIDRSSNTTSRKARAGVGTITMAMGRRTMAALLMGRGGPVLADLTGERGHYELAAGRDPSRSSRRWRSFPTRAA